MKIKVELPKGQSYVLTLGKQNSLYLFEGEQWEGFISELQMLAGSRADAKMFMRHLMRTAVEVEVDEENEIEIPQMLWDYLTLGNANAQIQVMKVKEEDYIGIAGKYHPWIISQK